MSFDWFTSVQKHRHKSDFVRIILSFSFADTFERLDMHLILTRITNTARFCKKKKIFIQFFVITTCLLLFEIPFVIIGYLPEASPWFGYFVTMAYILNCSINGWVYFFMNKMIRIEFKKIFFRRNLIDTTKQSRDETRWSKSVAESNSLDEERKKRGISLLEKITANGANGQSSGV